MLNEHINEEKFQTYIALQCIDHGNNDYNFNALLVGWSQTLYQVNTTGGKSEIKDLLA